VVGKRVTVIGGLVSTVDFVLEYFVSRLMPTSTGKTGANRTFMLVVVEVAAGLPFECANPVVTGFCSQHSFIGFSCSIFLLCLFPNTNSANHASR